MKKVSKIISYVMAVVMLLNLTSAGLLKQEVVQASQVMQVVQLHYDIDGVGYDVKKTVSDAAMLIEVSSSALGNDQIAFKVSDDSVTSEYREYTGKNKIGKETYSIQSKTVQYNRIEDSIDATLMSITYGTKVYENYENRYYYCWGFDGNKDYLKIGCDYNYRLRYDTLSSAKQGNVQNYISLIGECRGAMNSAYANLGGAGVAMCIAFITTCAAAMLASPEDIAVALIAAGCSVGLGACVAGVINCIDAKGIHKEIHNQYETIKLYGTKL